VLCCNLTAPSREAQASDALLALAKMQPLSAGGTTPASEQEIEDLKHQVSTEKLSYFETECIVVNVHFV